MTGRFFTAPAVVITICLVFPTAGKSAEYLLTFEEALKRTFAASPVVVAAQANLDASDERVYETRAGFLPQANRPSTSFRNRRRNALEIEASEALLTPPAGKI